VASFRRIWIICGRTAQTTLFDRGAYAWSGICFEHRLHVGQRKLAIVMLLQRMGGISGQVFEAMAERVAAFTSQLGPSNAHKKP
jgi:hypothetical protein